MGRSRHQQPWERVDIGGKRCRIQVLDPETAFALEPKLVDALGDQLSLIIAAPRHVGEKLLAANREPDVFGTKVITEIATVARLLQSCLVAIDIDADFILELTETMLLGHIEAIGHGDLETWEDWSEVFGSAPRPRWAALATAIRLTYGPLWTRSPYRLRTPDAQDFGVPLPPGVSNVRMWADQIATRGSAPSARDVLTTWTPLEVIESVESIAYTAERERRAYAAAQGGSR